MNEKDLERLIDKFDKSSLKDFQFSNDKFTLSFSKRLDSPANSIEVSTSQAKPVIESDTKVKEQTIDEPDNFIEVKSPLVGIVYLASAPDQPVYKKVGDSVKKGDVVCLVEAMKMINEVKSKFNGTIKEVLVKDGDMVQYDQPIFKIAEDQ